MTTTQTNYELDANTKLTQVGGTIKIKLSNTKECPWRGENIGGDHYRFTLETPHGTYTSDYWGSHNDMTSGKEPSAYDVLSCLTWHNPGEFSDFCSEFGYSVDSISALQTYRAVFKQWNALRRIFPADADRELLATIN